MQERGAFDAVRKFSESNGRTRSLLARCEAGYAVVAKPGTHRDG